MNRGCFVLCLSWDTVHPGKPCTPQSSQLNLTISGHARLPLSGYKLGGLFAPRPPRQRVG
jgi:hypothetical protein